MVEAKLAEGRAKEAEQKVQGRLSCRCSKHVHGHVNCSVEYTHTHHESFV